MASRLELHQELIGILGSNYVYFQPPETVKLKYPAIIYELAGIYHKPANDKKYIAEKRYTVTFIHLNPDITYSEEMYNVFPMCSFDRRFVNDNLYHDVYTLYY